MKKFVLIFLLIFSFSFLYGCQPQKEKIKDDYILLALASYAGGEYSQSIRFSCNSKFVTEICTSPEEPILFRNNLLKVLSDIRNEFLFSLAIKYMSNPQEEFKIGRGVVLSSPAYYQPQDFVGFDIIFTSTASCNYYHNIEAGESDKVFLAKKLTSSGTFPFSSLASDGKPSGLIYKERYLSAAKGLSIENDLKENYNPQYIYDYSSPIGKLKSDATIVYRGSDKNYHHMWIKDELNYDDKINISLVIINKAWWLFFALTIPLTCCIVSLIIIAFSHRKFKGNNKK